MGYYNTFVVRVWCDDIGEPGKGYVQHVISQEKRYFLKMDDLTAFILDHLSPPKDDFKISTQGAGKYITAENLGDILQDGREL